MLSAKKIRVKRNKMNDIDEFEDTPTIRKILLKVSSKRTYDDILQLKSLLLKRKFMSALFSHFLPRQVDEFCFSLTLEKYAANYTTFQQGDTANKVYIVMTGLCDISVNNSRQNSMEMKNETELPSSSDKIIEDEPQNIIIGQVKPGQYFGEDILTNEDKFPNELKLEICSLIDLVYIPAYTTLFTENEIGQAFYMIFSGTVKISQKFRDEYGEEYVDTLNILKDGDYFGERALEVETGVRTASAHTQEQPTNLLVIFRSDYFNIMHERKLQETSDRIRLLKLTHNFANIPENLLNELCLIMELKTYRSGQI
eukprot:gene15476-32708_t